jgi:very-short-patch-repair endonuclease
MHIREIQDLASGFRRNPTRSENYLWQFLKGKQLCGRKFLRQHPIIYQNIQCECFFFIPDFYCHQEKLVIELDGGVHDERTMKDKHRDLLLRNFGLRVLRISNYELTDIDSVLEKIKVHFTQ